MPVLRRRLRVAPALLLLLLLAVPALAHPAGVPHDRAELERQLVEHLGGMDSAKGALSPQPLRCATWLLREARRQRDLLSAPAREALELFETRLGATADLGLRHDSAGGHFVVLYDTEGFHAVPPADDDLSGVPDYVEWVAEAMEESWVREVDELGYLPPVLGGQRFEVVLEQLGGVYGFTEEVPGAPGGQRITIHADFVGFYLTYDLPNDDPDGQVRGGIRVTAAHEFKHVCQWNESAWSEVGLGLGGLLEVDAVWMEDVAYDQVNDYYNYLEGSDSPFAHPESSLMYASYGGSNWQHYMSERHGMDLVRDYSARRGSVLQSEAPQFSYREVFGAAGLDFEDGWGEYLQWVYLVGDHRLEGEGFGEADRYPTPRVRSVESVLPAVGGSSGRLLPPLSGQFHRFENVSGQAGTPTVSFAGSALVTWSVRLLLEAEGEVVALPVTVAPDGTGSLTAAGYDLGDFEAMTLVVGNASVTSLTGAGQVYDYELTMDTVEGFTPFFSLSAPAPNPFDESTALSFVLPRSGPVSVVLYDLRGRRVKTVYEGSSDAGAPQPLTLDAQLPDGGRLASGVYLLKLTSGALEATRRVVHVH